MLNMSMQILEVIIQHKQETPNEIFAALSQAFPNKSRNALHGYVIDLARKGYLATLPGDNWFSSIIVNHVAYAALDEAMSAPDPVPQLSPSIQVGNINGPVAMGNHGGNYTLTSTNTFTQAMDAGLREALAMADTHEMDTADREEIKELLTKMLQCLEKSEPPPAGFLCRLSEKFQKHSWIAAPIASKALTVLSSLFR